MRTPKLEAPPAINRQVGLVEQVRQYEVITPMYGGGVEPAQADPVSVVRGTEIRGQLRFWWRATRGGAAEGSLEKLRELEGTLWGTAARSDKASHSQVQIAVRVETAGNLVTPFRLDGKRVSENPAAGVPAYAAFPLQPTQDEMRAGTPLKQVRTGVTFTLILQYPQTIEQREEVKVKVAEEVAAAVWAWETFGGIGARTRRGFGALRCVRVNGQAQALLPARQMAAQIQKDLQQYVGEGRWPQDVPHLTRQSSFKTVETANVQEAWQTLIMKLRQFRGARTGGRFGSSQWPEPDAIRRRTGGSPKGATPASRVDKFPRAALGLPISFHFRDEGANTPPDTSLQPLGYDRLASPLILRPLACREGAVGLALILDAPLPAKLELKGATPGLGVNARLSAADALNISPLDGNPDVLDAFLKTL